MSVVSIHSREPLARSSEAIVLAREPDFLLAGLTARPSTLQVQAGDHVERLERRVMQVLVALAQAHGGTVSREELAERCWDGRVVGEDALQRCIRRLRGVAELPGGPHFEITTVPRVGYRLCVRADAVQTAQAAGWDAPPDPEPRLAHAGRKWAAALLVLAIACTGLALGWRRLAPARAQATFVAVLPFHDLSAGKDKAYFAEGVSEQILGDLAHERGLKVMGRTSAAQFRDHVDLQALRRALGVSHVLEGSVQSDGGLVRVNVRLLRSSDGAEVWSERYQRPLANIFAIQDEIGGSVARRLRGALTDHNPGEAAPRSDVHAYDLYLAARVRMRERDEASLAAAAGLLNQALQSSPAYAPALGALSEVKGWQAYAFGGTRAERLRGEAIDLARTAIRVAPSEASGYAGLGLALYENGPQADSWLERAIRLAPARNDLRSRLAQRYNEESRYADELRTMREAYALEPLSFRVLDAYVKTLAYQHRANEAEQVIQRYAPFADAPFRVAYLRRTVAETLGDLPQAIRFGASVRKAVPDDHRNNLQLAMTYRALGFYDRASAILPSAQAPMLSMHLAGRRKAAADLAAAAGPSVWDDHFDGWFGIQALAFERRWADLVRLYDSRFRTAGEFCGFLASTTENYGLLQVPALRVVGRVNDARAVLACTAQVVRARLARAPWSEDVLFTMGRVLALEGDQAGAASMVERSLAGAPHPQYAFAVDLAEDPTFRSVVRQPKFEAARTRLLARIADQRTEAIRQGLAGP